MSLAYRIAGRQRVGLGRPRIKVKTLQAPTGGWNARDPLSDMGAEFATILENLFPSTGAVVLRKGYASHATAVGSAAVESLFTYSADGTDVLLAGGGGSLYDVTAAGTAVSLSTASAYTSNQWQGVNFNSVGIIVNGADAVQSYDGSTLSAVAFTGSATTITSFIYVASFKERLFFVETDTANFWYGAIKQITAASALNKFALGAVHPAGGRLKAIGSFTIDGGSGPDDYAAFLFENGDVAVYAGTDPGDSNAWSLLGRFKIGRPIGRHPLLQLGNDLIAITEDGYMPIRQFMGTGRVGKQLAVSDNISSAVTDAVKLYGTLNGWQIVFYPAANMLIANVPLVAGSQSEQHVMNTLTGAWCKFTGLNANCWAVIGNKIYFGGQSGVVYQFNTGNNDNGAEIQSDGQTAFTYYGGGEALKLFTMFRPHLQSDNPISVGMGLGVDFAEGIVVTPATVSGDTGSQFDVALFDVALFGGGLTQQDEWQSASELGYSAAVRLQTRTTGHNIAWYATSVGWKPGGVL